MEQILNKIETLRSWRRDGTIKITKEFREDDFETLLNQIEIEAKNNILTILDEMIKEENEKFGIYASSGVQMRQSLYSLSLVKRLIEKRIKQQ
jgi:hypothetical protein